MNSRFHIPNLSSKRNLTRYPQHPGHSISHTNPARHIFRHSFTFIVMAAGWALWARAQPPPAGPNPPGFAPPSQNLLTPLLRLAPPGRPDLALQTFERIHDLDRKLILHPALSPGLRGLLDKLPAPEVIPIEMGSLYADSHIPWRSAPSNAHFLAVDGHPDGAAYIYDLASRSDPPQLPNDLEAVLRVIPQAHQGPPPAQSVTAELKGSLYISGAMAPDSAMDTALGFEHEIYGTMAPPWDQKPGAFNQHDQAAIARLR
ncbi:MAG TPA: hypothetical protein VGH29_03410, partial [Candidatus Binataceae bacterium]